MKELLPDGREGSQGADAKPLFSVGTAACAELDDHHYAGGEEVD